MKQTLMKQVLEALNLSGAKLASELTAHRRDGKTTSEATISRWVNGHVEPPLGIWPWLRERLIQRAMLEPPPTNGPKLIFIGGAKPGCGTSSACVFLAITARMMGYNVAIGQTDRGNLSHWAAGLSDLPKIDTLVDLSNLKSVKAEMTSPKIGFPLDFLFVDDGNLSMSSLRIHQKIDLSEIDLWVMPCNPLSETDIAPADPIIRWLNSIGCHNLMLLPVVDSSSLSALIKARSMPPAIRDRGHLFSDAVIFRRHNIHQPTSSLIDPFDDRDMEFEYLKAFKQILKKLGVDQELIDMSSEQLEALDIESLLHIIRCRDLPRPA